MADIEVIVQTTEINVQPVDPLKIGPAGTNGLDGDDGWSLVPAIVSDGERRVLQVVDWTGGTGTKPATGSYIGATGLVAAIGDAIDIRGASGTGGGGSVWTYVFLESDVTITNFTPVQLLSFALAANKVYEIEGFYTYSSTSTSLGVCFEPMSNQGADTTIVGHALTYIGTNGSTAAFGVKAGADSVPTGLRHVATTIGGGTKASAVSKYIIKTNSAATISLDFWGENTGATYVAYGGKLTFLRYKEIA